MAEGRIWRFSVASAARAGPIPDLTTSMIRPSKKASLYVALPTFHRLLISSRWRNGASSIPMGKTKQGILFSLFIFASTMYSILWVFSVKAPCGVGGS